MATRSGSVDPGALLYLIREHGLGPRARSTRRSSTSPASRRSRARPTHARSSRGSLALGVFAYRLAVAVAADGRSTGGLDAIAFTAGIGEGSALVRGEVCRRLAFLGVGVDEGLNDSAVPDCDVGDAGSAVRVVVVRAREEIVAARAARAVLTSR